MEPADGGKDQGEILFCSDDEPEVLYETSDSMPEGDEDGSGEVSQEDVLMQTSSEDADHPPKRRRYTRRRSLSALQILGKSVCLQAHKRIYGVGSASLQQLRNQRPAYSMRGENRLAEAKHPTLGFSVKRNAESYKWPHILGFFWLLYISAAEILPTRLVMPDELFKGKSVGVKDDDDNFEDRYINSFMRNLDMQFDPLKVGQVGPGSFQGPRRYLEWSRPTDLYLQYCAICETESRDPAGLSTFMRIFKQVMGKHLKFRGKTEHAQCTVCYHLRERIKKARSAEMKQQATRNYTQHLLSQWLDRRTYWNARQVSRNFFYNTQVLKVTFEESALCAIIDGMDQSKLRLPKFGSQRVNKNQELLFRPTCHLTACWLHGFKLFLPLSDEDVKKNSETQMEILMRSLSELRQKHRKLPQGFWTQADNCFRESKNKYLFSLNLLLVCPGVFRWSVMSFLRTAHSHEDVDQCFGQISRLFACKRFDNPKDMIDLLNECSGKHAASGSGKGRLQTAAAYKLDQVSNWKAFTAQTGISILGMRRVHYFRICRRVDIGSETLSNVADLEEFPYGSIQPHPEDIFLVTKRWLHDVAIARVIALIPADKASTIRRSFAPPGGLAARRAIGVKVAQNLQSRVPKLKNRGELSEKSARYLLEWVNGIAEQQPKPDRYSILDYRYNPSMEAEGRLRDLWVTPTRYRRVDVTLQKMAEGDEVGASDDDSDNNDNAPIDMV